MPAGSISAADCGLGSRSPQPTLALHRDRRGRQRSPSAECQSLDVPVLRLVFRPIDAGGSRCILEEEAPSHGAIPVASVRRPPCSPWWNPRCTERLPRTRGGGPYSRTAGGSVRLPRTRGGGPYWILWFILSVEASPHTRGWTEVLRADDRKSNGFPAHAGTDPPGGTPKITLTRLPRTRGDGPLSSARYSKAAVSDRGFRSPQRLLFISERSLATSQSSGSARHRISARSLSTSACSSAMSWLSVP